MSTTTELNDLRLAVLIDADNAPRNCIKPVMEEIAIYGTPTVKRIYGDWTTPNLKGWKDSLLENAIVPIQQYAYTTGKNSTDSAMIIDAMDILYSGRTDGFCIVSSDSDFTRLAIRLREAGMKVIGIGEKKTPGSFIAACDKFIYIEVIRAAFEERARAAEQESQTADVQAEGAEKAAHSPAGGAQKKKRRGGRSSTAAKSEPAPEPAPAPAPEKAREKEKEREKEKVPASIVKLIADSVSDIADEDGYAFMGELGNLLLKKQPDFDPRNFGFKKLTTLIKSLPRFEVDVRQTGDAHIKHIYLRDREA